MPEPAESTSLVCCICGESREPGELIPGPHAGQWVCATLLMCGGTARLLRECGAADLERSPSRPQIRRIVMAHVCSRPGLTASGRRLVELRPCAP